MRALGPGARRRLRRLCFTGVAACYVLAIPWYRATGAPVTLVAGVPDWVAVALACYGTAALLNAAAWWLADLRDELPAEEDAP